MAGGQQSQPGGTAAAAAAPNSVAAAAAAALRSKTGLAGLQAGLSSQLDTGALQRLVASLSARQQQVAQAQAAAASKANLSAAAAAAAAAGLLQGNNSALTQALALAAGGGQHLNALRNLDRLQLSVQAAGLKQEANNAPRMDVESILASVRGAIGSSLAQVNLSQLPSLGPSTSHMDDESLDGSDDEAPTKSKSKKPPSCKDEFLDLQADGVNSDDQKKLKRRISNRECARRIRQRRQEQLVSLGGRIDTLRMENAKLMIRLTEVMKCWHEIAGENRMLKSQLATLKQGRSASGMQNAALANIINNTLAGNQSAPSTSQAQQVQNQLMKVLASSGKDTGLQASDLASLLGGITPDVLRALLASGSLGGSSANAGSAPSSNDLTNMDLGALAGQGSSDIGSHITGGGLQTMGSSAASQVISPEMMRTLSKSGLI